MISRPRIEAALHSALGRSPIVALLGARQTGKTTLARHLARSRRSTCFDLESPVDLARLDNPMLALDSLSGLVVLDEIQLRPDLFPILRVLADRDPPPCQFLVLGSASPDLVRSSSETLAGRVEFVSMGGFDLNEVGRDQRNLLWSRGGFPRSFLATHDEDSYAWRQSFIQTFLERDIPRFGVQVPPMTIRRLWSMLAHYHGQTLNASALGRNFGLTDKTIRRYVDLLCGTYVVRLLPPWYENLAKRQVKAPKVYLTDSGLVHALLGVQTHHQLLGHPKVGASWEGFALDHVLRRVDERQAYFWATHSGAELDLMVLHQGRRLGFEFKLSDAPTLTRSMHISLEDLGLHHLWVVYPGSTSYRLHESVTAVGLDALDKIEALVPPPARQPG
jgi:uncharacterized protein